MDRASEPVMIARRRPVTITLAAALVAGCSGTGPAPSGAAGQTPAASQHGGLPDLGLQNVTTDTASARGAAIGRAGGSITATGSNGVAYTLTVPEGALATPAEIGLYPVMAISTLPAGAMFVAGVQFSPDGLHLLVPASLTITVPAGTDPRTLTGVAWAGDGQGIGPWLADPGSSSLVLPVLHFSGDGVASGDLVPLADLATCGSMGDMIGLMTEPGQTGADYTADLRLCWEGLVQPALLKSTAEASQGIGADTQPPIDDYDMWLAAIHHAAVELGDASFTVSPEVDDSKAIAGQFLRSWYDAWNDQCVADAPISSAIAIAEAVSAMDFVGRARKWSVATAGARLDTQTVLDDLCVQVVIEPDRHYTASVPGQTGSVVLTAGYQVAGGPTVHDASIDVVASTGADAFEAITDANGTYDQDIAWPSGVDPIQIDLLATLLVSGVATSIARFDRITKGSSTPPPPTATPSAPSTTVLTDLTRVSGVSPCPGGGPSCSFDELGPWSGSGGDSTTVGGVTQSASASQMSDVEVNIGGLILKADFSGAASGSHISGSSRLNLDFTLLVGATYTIKGGGSGNCFEIGLDGLNAEGGAVPIFDQDNCGASTPIDSAGTLPAGSYHYVVKLDSGGNGGGNGQVTLTISP
jgi:hypothetical protein